MADVVIEERRGDVLLLPTPRSAGPATLTDGFYYACLEMKADGA